VRNFSGSLCILCSERLNSRKEKGCIVSKYFLIGWLPGLCVWFARQRGGYYITDESLDVVLRQVKECKMPVVIDRELAASEVLKIVGACTFLGIKVITENGEVVKPTPVVDGKIRYVTNKELGPILPDGWMIECQLNQYAACFGEELSFPYRKTMQLAINDMRNFLEQSVLSASSDLAASISADTTMEQAVMDFGLVSSDKPRTAAVDAVHRA